jgi:predicted RecB family nuclease
MTDDLQEIDGVGPAREERLIDAGYETYEDLAEADHEVLADEIQRLPEDSALDVVVQAQNLADLQDAEVEEGPDVEEEPTEEEIEEELDDLEEELDEELNEEEGEPADGGEDTLELTLSFGSSHEYDTFYHTLIEQRCALKRTNRSGVESYERMLESMRKTADDGEFTVAVNEDELNEIHNAVLEQRISYQGENLIDYMDALRAVEESINDVREELLF